MRYSWRSLTATMLATFCASPPASAQSPQPGFWDRPALLGPIGGLRPALDEHGVTLTLNDSENLLGNLSGGVKQGATLQGVTTATLEVETGKAFGLAGGMLHVSALQLHGQGLSGPYLDNLQSANGNEGENGTRLWELWYDQAFDHDLADIKVGQQSIDNEFMVSSYSGLFVNTMAGWPLLPSADLYGGGPAYPLATLGARLQARLSPSTTLLAGVFDDNPGGGGFSTNAQARDGNGALFNLNTGALWIAELQYSTMIGGLSGTYKIGYWYDSGSFPDQRFGTDGLSLANPASNGTPWPHRGNDSLYGVLDQTIWQSSRDKARSVNIFARIMAAPTAQNLISFAFNGGVTMTAPWPGRDNDQIGIDFGLGKISPRAATLDRAAGLPARGTEDLFELTYQAQLTGWLIVQPDLQYVINPGGGVLNPDNPGHKLANELVAGVRIVTSF